MIISIASGKGGTGKTTVATNMAMSLLEDVQLLDCDVEEPNAHLFLRPDIHSSVKVSVPIPKIDHTLCSYCKKCSDICRFNAITVVGKNVLLFPELCHSCGGCMEVCPEKAITETKREIGQLESGMRDEVEFIHGRMRVGEAMSPPLIKKVRETTDCKKITIIDAPPGTSCPVITAVKGVDFVLLVTEPTPFGLHDLKLAVETIRLLDIPCGLVINRAGLGDDKVYDYAQEQNIPILMEIPFNREIAQMYSQGKMMALENNNWMLKFQQLFLDIKTVIGQHRGTIQ